MIEQPMQGFFSSVVLFYSKYRLCHPGNYLFLLSVKIVSGSKYPKHIIFHFEKRSTASHRIKRSAHLIRSSAKLIPRSAYLIPRSSITQLGINTQDAFCGVDA